MSSPCFGRIVWATIPDGRRLARERHPAVIITPTDDITDGGTFWVVGVSTKDHLSPPAERTELQFDPTGRCRTKLKRRCWAVSTWLEEIAASDVESYVGIVSDEVMAEIVGKIPKVG
jgi:PemK-like, MazF-like toxin of type II toxin-antitoxin system